MQEKTSANVPNVPESHESNVPERHPYREKFTVEEAKGAHVLRWSWVDLPIIASCPL
jgi:hypothetical protein